MALKEMYKITIDWKGGKFGRVTLEWNYTQQHVDLSMPNYVPAALHKFQHKVSSIPVNSPHACSTPIYCTAPQWAQEPDTSPLLSPQQKNKPSKYSGHSYFTLKQLSLPCWQQSAKLQASKLLPWKNGQGNNLPA
eukprot:9164135-Ditylum_brightwellii.AAC.1